MAARMPGVPGVRDRSRAPGPARRAELRGRHRGPGRPIEPADDATRSRGVLLLLVGHHRQAEGHPAGDRVPAVRYGRRAGPADAPGVRVRPDSVYLCPAPLYHAAPLGWSMGTTGLGGTVVLMDRFDPAECLRAIAAHHVTAAQFVPTHFVRLLKLPDRTRRAFDLSGLRTVVHAAAPCPVEVKQAMIDWLGPVLCRVLRRQRGQRDDDDRLAGLAVPSGLRRPGSRRCRAHPRRGRRRAAGWPGRGHLLRRPVVRVPQRPGQDRELAQRQWLVHPRRHRPPGRRGLPVPVATGAPTLSSPAA